MRDFSADGEAREGAWLGAHRQLEARAAVAEGRAAQLAAQLAHAEGARDRAAVAEVDATRAVHATAASAADAIRAEAQAAFEARAALAEEHARLFVDDKRRAFRAGAVAERVNRGSMGGAPPSPYCAPSPVFRSAPARRRRRAAARGELAIPMEQIIYCEPRAPPPPRRARDALPGDRLSGSTAGEPRLPPPRPRQPRRASSRLLLDGRAPLHLPGRAAAALTAVLEMNGNDVCAATNFLLTTSLEEVEASLNPQPAAPAAPPRPLPTLVAAGDAEGEDDGDEDEHLEEEDDEDEDDEVHVHAWGCRRRSGCGRWSRRRGGPEGEEVLPRAV